MKPIIFIAGAITLYAIQNVVLEQKLSSYSTFSLLLYCYVVMLPLALLGVIYQKLQGAPVAMPSGSALLIILVVGAMYFVADALFFGAYTNGGNMVTITTLMALFPIVATIIRYFMTGQKPNGYHVVAFAMTVITVYFVAKGNSLQ